MNLQNIKEFNFLNPDGVEISCDYFDCKQKAKDFYKKWLNIYKQKGFYISEKYGIIEYHKLKKYCNLITLELQLRT